MDNKFRSFLVKYCTWIYLGWVLLIGILTLIPGRSIPNIIDWNFFSLDKVIHFSIFFTLTFLGALNFHKHSNKYLTAIAISIGIAVFYGTIVEYLQTYIPDRGFDYADLTANVFGSLFGGYWYFLNRKKLLSAR